MSLPEVPPAPGPATGLPPRYAAGPLLGQGGMGRVYRARDRVLGVDVAVKLVRPDLAADPRVRERLRVEVRMAARLPHPHLVPLHDLGELDDGTPFFAMALADEGSLATFRGGWAALAGRVDEVLAALGALHARGVLHRDLKPENVLLHAGRAWVSDLGLADVADRLAARTGDVSGTPEYMAPEQRAGRLRELGPWTDLYAVGRVVDRLTLGKRVPAGLDALLQGLLHADPYARPRRAAEARAALAALGPPEVTRARPAPAPRRASPTLYPSKLEHTEIGAAPRRGEAPGGAGPAFVAAAPPPFPALPPPEQGRGAFARASVSLLPLREVPLVGRDAERARLWALAGEVVATGEPRVVLLVGEAGAGKTRLATSVAHALDEGGWMEQARFVYRAPATPEDGYGGAARRLLRPSGESPDTFAVRLERQLARDHGDEAPEWAVRLRRWCGVVWPDEPTVDRAVGLAWWWARLRANGARGGTCLLLDDAHLADAPDGLALARNLLDQAAGGEPVPVLVLATVRADALAASRTLAQQVAGLVEDGAVRIDLPRLDRAGTAALVDELLTLTPDLAELVAARCEGNPLLARLLLASWAEGGLLDHGGDLAHGLRPGIDVSVALPGGSADLFARRVDTLLAATADPTAARGAVAALALADAVLPEPVFVGIAGESAAGLVATGLFRRDGAAVTWDHRLMHEAVRAEVLRRADVPDLHARVAAAWTAWGEASGAWVDDQVGVHLVDAGEPRRALRLLLPAAKRAERSGRMASLLRLATAAQAAADVLGAPALLEAREARALRARALTVRGELAAAESLLDAADTLAGSIPPGVRTLPKGLLPEDVGRVPTPALPVEVRRATIDAYTAGVWGHLQRMRARLPDAEAAFAAAREGYGALGDRAAQADAALHLAGCRRHAHAFDDAQALYDEALAGYRAAGDPRGVAYALRELGVLASWRGRRAEAEARLEEARAAFVAVGEGTGAGVAMSRLAQLALAAGDTDRAAALLREAMRRFVDAGAPLEVQNCRNDLAEVARMRGDLPAARAGYRAAVRWAEERGWREMTAIGRINLALVALAADEPAEALVEADRALDALARSRDHWLRPFSDVVRACAYAASGQPGEAARRLAAARKRGLGAQADRDLAWALDRLATRARADGHAALADDAATLADRVRPATPAP